jgi:hypothetical protein
MHGVCRANRAHFVLPGYSIIRTRSAFVFVDQERIILTVKNLPGAGSDNDCKPDEHGAV